MMTNTKMSVFNRYTDSFTHAITFNKHVIDNVFWDDSTSVNLDKGYDADNKVNVYIPKDKNDMSKYVDAKHYNGTGWTLNEGDLIIKGDVTETTANGIKDLASYKVFTITTVDDKDFGSANMHHFEIRGK